MDLLKLQHYLGLENDDKRFGFLIAQPFMANIMQVPFDDWKDTFIGAFLHKYTDRPQILRMMSDALGVQYVSWKHLTRVNLTTITQYILDRVAPNSACTYLSLIKSLLNDYSEENLIPCRSLTGVLTGKHSPSQHIALTEDEMKALDAYVPRSITERHTKNLFMRCLYTGCRCSDAKELTLENVSNDILSYVSKKTKTEVNQPVHHRLLKYLAEDCGNHGASALRVTIQRICKKLGINQDTQLYVAGELKRGPKYLFISMHSARRSFCTILAQKDVPVETIRTLAGHSTTNMTDRYICIDGKKPGANAMSFFHG